MIDLSGNANFQLIAPELLLCGFGFVILLCGVIRALRPAAFPVALIGLLATLCLVVSRWEGGGSSFFGMVTKDSFSSVFTFIFLFSGVITFLLARSYLRAHRLESPEFYALVIFSILGMLAMASSYDLIVIFVGLEIMSLPLYVLAALERKRATSLEAGLKYFIMGAFASGFLLYGIALIYGASGSTDLRVVTGNFMAIAQSSPWFLTVGALLTLVGFGFKVAAVPFHMWAPDVYEGAPTPVTAFFSVGPKAAGFAALLRIFSYGFGAMDALEPYLWTLAALTMLVGNLFALYQSNIKRMLAYSSIAHAGYALVAVAVGGDSSIAAAVYYLIAYAFFNFGAFAILSLMDSRPGAQSRMDDVVGLSSAHPALAALLALFMFALAGFPPTAGFFGKFYIFAAAVESGYITLAVIGVLASFVSVYYYLRVVVQAYFVKPDRPFATPEVSPLVATALALCAVGTLALGLFPSRWIDVSKSAVIALLQ